MADAKAGERYQCGTCGTQVVVIKTEGEIPQCCGAAMLSSSGGATPRTPPSAAGETPAAKPAG